MAGKTMAGLRDLIDDTAARFGLGLNNVRLIMQEVFGLIESEPHGLDGFLEKIKGVDLEAKETFRFRGSSFKVLPAAEVRRAAGADVIRRVGQIGGLPEHRTIDVLGYVIPKTIVLLTQDRKLPGSLPHASSSMETLLQLPREGTFAFESEEQTMLRKKALPPHMRHHLSPEESHLIAPGVALVLTLGVIGYAVFSGTSRDESALSILPGGEGRSVAEAANVPAASDPASQEEKALVAQAQSLANAMPAKRPGITLNEALGRGRTSPGLAFAISRVENFSPSFEGFGGSGAAKLFAGNVRNFGEEGGARAFLLASVLSPNTKPGKMARGLAKTVPAEKPVIAQAAPQPAGPHEEPVGQKTAIDFPVIVFAPNSAKLPPNSRPELQRLAGELKLLAPGTVVELDGYTYGRHSSRVGIALSLRRAEAVRQFLIGEGVSESLLKAKGNGSALQAALANDTLEGRSSTVGRMAASHDRRVEFRFRIIPAGSP